ncbi:hypothetical protein KC316_g16719 [Hortaea werneckii]|nr:hypothetical protein KC316_g16719 [Hortaea werneckii]
MLSGAFGGLYAAGIAAAFENHRIASWRWLFITEGAATMVFGAFTAFLIPDWPATTKWLKDDERALGVVRLIEDAGEEEEDIDTKAAAKMAVKDYRVWLCVLGQFCLQAVASLTNFLPTLVKNFGFDTINTLLLTAPPYIFTVLVCIANTCARPQKKRAIGLAMNNAIGNLAQVWTPYLYPESDGPRYTMAWSVNLALCVVIVVSTTALSFSLKRENRKLNNIETDVELSQHEDLGKDPPLDITCIEHHSEHAVAGRRLGGRWVGATARYDT